VSGGRSYGGIHGPWHAPRGSDPSACDAWRPIVAAGAAWSSGTNYSPGDVVDDDFLQYECILANGPGVSGVGTIRPGVDSLWMAYWWCQASVWVNGSNMTPTVAIPNPVPLRYRLSVGPPNVLEVDGSLLEYTEHQIEIQGDVTGLVSGDTVFILPLEYRHEYDVPYHTHDDLGNYVPCRMLSTGEFVYGAA